jgi:signal transduction histidine kinase
MVPIRLDSPIGAIGVYWAKHRTATEAEVTLLQALANTTSVAMENMKVYTELEQRVASRTRQLELLNRELESFSYSVSHDLRAPLRAINGFSGLLVRELDSNPAEKVQRYVNVIADSAIKMTALIEDLLKLSRVARERLRRIDVDLAAIARTIAQRLRTEDPRREAELVIPEQLVVRGDAGLMAVVMENLLSNAWKYTSKTGRARIVLGTRAEADGSTAVYVEDNGAGFDSSRAENLFSPFQRMHTAEEFPGTGVGLATVQRIIHRHGGRIWADAKPGQGARFSFTIADKDS